jgi:hypothetical protein
MTRADFLARVTHDGLGEDFIKYLTVRLASQQYLIASLPPWTASTGLAVTLLQLTRKLGKRGDL